MQTLQVDFSNIPDAPPLGPGTLSVDFSDIPDAVGGSGPGRTPGRPEDFGPEKNILKADFSNIPDAPEIEPETLRVDFSDIPDADRNSSGLVNLPMQYYHPVDSGVANSASTGPRDPAGLPGADLFPVDPQLSTANASTGGPGGGPVSPSGPGEQSGPFPGGSAVNIYKQWLIGAIDFFAKFSWNAPVSASAPDVSFESMTGRPYQSPFAPPKDVGEAAARLMGGFQGPALAGLAIEAAAPLAGAAEAAEIGGLPQGEWVEVNESMPTAARTYQTQVTGKTGRHTW